MAILVIYHIQVVLSIFKETLFQRKIQEGKQKRQSYDCLFMEAPPRLELGIKVLQTSALPLGYGAIKLIENTECVFYFVERITRLELATFTLAR